MAKKTKSTNKETDQISEIEAVEADAEQTSSETDMVDSGKSDAATNVDPEQKPEAAVEDEVTSSDGPVILEEDLPSADQPAEGPAEPVGDSDDIALEDVPEPQDNAAEDFADSNSDMPPPETSEPIHEPQPEIIRETVVERRDGFWPMAGGGLVAAALGYGAATYSGIELPFLPAAKGAAFEEEVRGLLADQSGRIDAAVESVEKVQEGQTGLADAISGNGSALETGAAQMADLQNTLEALSARLTALEERPIAEGGPTTGEVLALQQALADFESKMASQESQIAAAAEAAEAARAKAEAQAARAKSRVAISEISAAVQTGAPYAEALEVVQSNGITIPDPLPALAASGVPSAEDLAETLPDLAREALNVARATGEGTIEGGGFKGFLKNTLGSRSVTPREGSDADAVLSRVEAAMRARDLDTVLLEIDALPQSVRDVLAGWAEQAAQRQAALSAVTALVNDTDQE